MPVRHVTRTLCAPFVSTLPLFAALAPAQREFAFDETAMPRCRARFMRTACAPRHDDTRKDIFLFHDAASATPKRERAISRDDRENGRSVYAYARCRRRRHTPRDVHAENKNSSLYTPRLQPRAALCMFIQSAIRRQALLCYAPLKKTAATMPKKTYHYAFYAMFV